MTGRQYRTLCERFFAGEHPSDEGLSAAARWLDIDPRTSRLWAEQGPSKAAAIKLLRLMEALELTPAAVDKLLARRRAR